MARRGIPRVKNALKIDPAVHLWTLRILVDLGAHREFVNTFGIQNNTVAKAIGLGHWVDTEATTFDLKAVRAELRLLHRKAENQSPIAPMSACLQRNVGRLSDLVGLSPTDRRILEFAVSLRSERLLYESAEMFGSLSSNKVYHALAVILDLPEAEI